jgi:hypothetical protein
MSHDSDKVRRDGRTSGIVSLTHTIKSSILRAENGWIYLDNFPEPIWYSEYTGLPKNKPMWFVLAYGTRWRLVDYLEEEEDKTLGMKRESWW